MSRFKCSRYARGFNFTEWFIVALSIYGTCRVVSIAGLASLMLHAVGLVRAYDNLYRRHLYARYPWPAQGSADADEIPARAMIAYMGRTRVC
ncbi:hypothetical protein EV363DRAFT_1150517 [Boletus edulis]|nr:hypothetical protein EV363DRAFT_1150517 [Boletus edulis]